MENVGMIIRKRRKELGWKVYELAKKVGVNPVYITQIEKHNKLPSTDVFVRIKNELNLKHPQIFHIYLTSKYPELFQRESELARWLKKYPNLLGKTYKKKP